MIEIYARETPPCSYCIAAVNLCEMKSLDYKKLILDVHYTLEDFSEQFPGARTFPQIKIDGNVTGGFKELQSALMFREMSL